MMKELKEIPKKNPFRVPDEYFSTLDDRIFASVSATAPGEKGAKKVFRLSRVMAIAASVTIIVAAGIIATMIISRDRNNPFPGDISLASDSYLYDIDILTLEERVAEEDVIPVRSGVDRKDIIDYLLLENIDESDIYKKIE